MRTSARTARRLACAALLTLATLGCDDEIDPQFPTDIAAPSEPAPTASTVSVVVSTSLEAVRQAAEAATPPGFAVGLWNHNHNGGPDHPHCEWNGGYDITRGPVQIQGAGSELLAAIDLSYWIKIRKRFPCPGPLFSFQCGTDGEPRRTATIRAGTSLTIDSSWTLKPASSVRSVDAGNRCIFGRGPWSIDMTDRITSLIGDRLNGMLSALDQRVVQEARLAERAREAWTQLQQPVAVMDQAWLSVNPQRVGIAPLVASATDIRFGLTLEALPVVTFGPQPAAPATPLPNPTQVPPSDAFNVLLPIELPYAEARAQLAKALRIGERGVRYPPTGKHHIRLTGVDVFGFGRQAVIELFFEGSAKGHAYLVRTPHYDAATQELSFPDLEFDVETRNLLLKAVNALQHERIRDDLRGRLRVNLGPPIAAMRQRMTAALNRQVGNVELKGTVGNLAFLGLRTSPQEQRFRADVHTNGTLAVTVK